MGHKIKLLISCKHVGGMAEIIVGPYSIEGEEYCQECESQIHTVIHHIEGNLSGQTIKYVSILQSKLKASLCIKLLLFVFILFLSISL